MRWSELFDDLQSALREQALAERSAEIADRTRRERASVTLADRLTAQRDSVDVVLLGGHIAAGQIGDVGADWLTLHEGGHAASGAYRSWLIPIGSLVQITGLGRSADADSAAKTVRRFGFGWAVRALARDRAGIIVHDPIGRMVTGTIDVVGADAIDLSEHPLDVPRRPENVLARRVIPFRAIVCVSSPGTSRSS